MTPRQPTRSHSIASLRPLAAVCVNGLRAAAAAEPSTATIDQYRADGLAGYQGNLTTKPNLRYTSGGTAVAEFRVLVNDRIKDGEEWIDGEPTGHIRPRRALPEYASLIQFLGVIAGLALLGVFAVRNATA